MNPRYLFAVLLIAAMGPGCRQKQPETPFPASHNQPGAVFVVGKEGDRIEAGGTIDVRDVAGVPQLTVDVHGD